ncbi:MAG: CCA tRNA nucleotidyltransferase [Acidimicrobiia bacterium]|nr:MAG: CCA tRNA nucleotidyltransferase [Acidimicrobiia bacterium]
MIPARLQPLLRATGVPARVAQRFAAAGHEAFLVGGGVRDALLGREREETEYDFTTAAPPDVIHELLEGWAQGVVTVGKEFGTIGARLDGVLVEVTTFRSEVYRDDSRKPSVEFTDDLATDLSRRDFTVNALALRIVPEPEIIDPHGGLVDLGSGLLRTPLSPEIAFGDDPLRMLRLYRFVSTLGFVPDPAALAAAAAMSDRLVIVSAERIREELDRLMVGDHVEAALWGVVESGLAEHFIPEIPALALEQDPRHSHKDVLAHTIAVVGKCPPDRIVRLAALFHDVGKPQTREVGPEGVSFHHHEVVGARMTRSRLQELRYPKDDVDDVVDLVYLHMRPHTFKLGWSDRAVRRYVRDAGHLLERLNTLVRCDVTTANDKKARQIQRGIDEMERRIAELRQQEEIDSIRPPLDGHAVMQHLALAPGPMVGEALDMLLEHRLDHGPLSEEEALGLLDRWWAERQQ